MDHDTLPTDPAAPDALRFPSRDAFGVMPLGDSPNYVPSYDAATVAPPATTEPAHADEEKKERTK